MRNTKILFIALATTIFQSLIFSPQGQHGAIVPVPTINGKTQSSTAAVRELIPVERASRDYSGAGKKDKRTRHSN